MKLMVEYRAAFPGTKPNRIIIYISKTDLKYDYLLKFLSVAVSAFRELRRSLVGGSLSLFVGLAIGVTSNSGKLQSSRN